MSATPQEPPLVRPSLRLQIRLSQEDALGARAVGYTESLNIYREGMSRLESYRTATDFGTGYMLDFAKIPASLVAPIPGLSGVIDAQLSQLDRLRSLTLKEVFDNRARNVNARFVNDVSRMELVNASPNDLLTNSFRQSLGGSTSDLAGVIALQAATERALFQKAFRLVAEQAKSQDDLSEGLQKVLEVCAHHGGEQRGALESLNGQVNDLSARLSKFMGDMDHEHQEIEKSPPSPDLLEYMESGVEFVKEFIFGEMTPSQQWSAIEEGKYEVSDQTKEKIKLAKDIQSFSSDAARYASNARQLIKLAQNLGLPPDDVMRATEVVNACSTLVQAGVSAATNTPMGYVAAANMVFSLLSSQTGEGSSTGQIIEALNAVRDEVRFTRRAIITDLNGLRNEVSNQLAHLQSGQDSIRADLQELLRGQKSLSSELTAVLEKLDDSEKRQYDFESKVLAALTRIERSTWVVREGLAGDRLDEDYRSLVTFANKSREAGSGAKLNTLSSSNEFFQLHRDSLKVDFRKADNFLRDRVGRGQDRRISPVFYSASYATSNVFDDATARDGYLWTVFAPAVRLLDYEMNTERKISQARYAQLFNPTSRLDKLDENNAVFTIKEVFSQTPSLRDHCGHLVDPYITIGVANALMELAPWYEIVDSIDNPTRVLSAEELQKDARTNQDGLDFLEGMKFICDVAIMQSTLLSGDILLAEMRSIFLSQFRLEEIGRIENEIRELEAKVAYPRSQVSILQQYVSEDGASMEAHNPSQYDNQIESLQKAVQQAQEAYREHRLRSRPQLTFHQVDSEFAAILVNRRPNDADPDADDQIKDMIIAISRILDQKDDLSHRQSADKNLYDRYEATRAANQLALDAWRGELSKISGLKAQLAERQRQLQSVSPSGDARHDAFRLLVEALRNNRQLQNNFALLCATEGLRCSGKSITQYRIALASTDKRLVCECLSLDPEVFVVERRNGHESAEECWQMLVDSSTQLYVVVPKALNVDRGLFEHSSELIKLVECRKRVVAEINDILIGQGTIGTSNSVGS